MWQYLVKRLFMLFGTLFGIAVVSFVIVTAAPGDPAALKASAMGKGRSSGISEFTTRKNRELFFLDRPVLINTSPATRTSTARETLKALDSPLEIERKDARSRLINDLGTAALDVLVASLPERLKQVQEEVARREQALQRLAGADPAGLTAVLEDMARAYPAYEPRFDLAAGEAPQPAELAEVWRRQREVFLREAEAPVRRVLEVLSSTSAWEGGVEGICPPEGRAIAGPPVVEETPLAEAAASWRAWWAEHSGELQASRARQAAESYTKGAEPQASIDAVGQLAAPALMEAMREADAGTPAEARAAAGLARACKKPWTLTLEPEELEKFRSDWKDKAAQLSERKERMHPSAYAREEASLGTLEEYVDSRRREELELRRVAWRKWWFRAEEYYVDFGQGRQLGRAFSQTQFGRWMSLLARFDFGNSYKHKRPVSDLIVERLVKVTLPLNAVALVLIYLVALPIGIYSATHQGTTGDRVSTVMLFLLYSIPSFWAASMLILFLTGEPFLDWFPAKHIESLDNENFSTGQKLLDWAHHGVLPVLCLTYGGIAYVAKQMRAGMLDVIRQDYIRTARAKGLSEKVVIYKHALRNGLIPTLTLMASLLPFLFGGSVIIEQVFTLEGLGKLAFDAILDRDYPVIMANLVISGFLTLLGILFTDVAYAIVDPRIEYR